MGTNRSKMFTEEALKRFKNPKNIGELKDHNGKGIAGDPECSDVIEIYIMFKGDKVVDAKFKVYGCPGAISTTDVFIDMIKGRKIDKALKIWGTTCVGETKLILWQPRTCRSSIIPAIFSGLTSMP